MGSVVYTLTCFLGKGLEENEERWEHIFNVLLTMLLCPPAKEEILSNSTRKNVADQNSYTASDWVYKSLNGCSD